MGNTLPTEYQELIWDWTWERLKANRISETQTNYNKVFSEWEPGYKNRLAESLGADSDIPIYTGSLALIVNALQYSPTITIEPGAVPATPIEGMIYFDTATKHFLGYNGTIWIQLDN